MEEGSRAVLCGVPIGGVLVQVVLTWGPSAQLVPESQALGRRGRLIRLGGEGSCMTRRQGDPGCVHYHVIA